MTHESFPSPMHFDMAMQVPVFAMTRRGMRIDYDVAEEFHEEYMARWSKYQSDLNRVAQRELNVNSSKQVKEFLYGTLNLPPRYHKKKLTTREDKIRSLMAECQDKVDTLKTEKGRRRWLRGRIAIHLILKVRSVRKRLSNYIPLPRDADPDETDLPGIRLDEDGRIRSLLSVGGTETGRFSSSKSLWGTGCNLQTIPRELRAMFVADPGKELSEFDLNRGESWIYSHLAEDIEMMDIHQSGRDFHSITGAAISRVFGEPVSVDWIVENKGESDKAYMIRYVGKRVNHASAYRMGEFRQAEVINEEADDTGITITVGQARESQEIWQQLYSSMPEWWNSIERQLNKNNRTIETPYGRTRTFHDWWGMDLFKEATAYIPQSTSVDYLNLGLLDVFHDLDQRDAFGLEVLHQNHDSIVFQYDEDRRDEVFGEVRERLERELVIRGCRGGRHKITIPVEGGYGHSWGDLTEYKF